MKTISFCDLNIRAHNIYYLIIAKMATSIAATAAASTTAQLRFLTDAAHLLRQTAPETSAYLMHHRTDVLAQNLAASASSSTTASNSIASSAQAALAFTQSDAQRQHVCTCCGHILIPGSNGTTLTIQSGRKSTTTKNSIGKRKRDAADQKDTRPDTKEAAHAGITKVFACGACNRETRIALPPPPPLSKNRRPKKPAAKNEQKPTQEAAVPSMSTTEHKAPARPQPSANPAVEAAPAAKSTNANSKKRAKNRKAGLLALLDKNKGNDSGGFGGLGLSFDDFRKSQSSPWWLLPASTGYS
ncbi:rnase p rpr2 rpp21 snm1 subunit domain-containing protein [Ophiostoma piceae UAMH 11346]|uniref:Rnase p rpr2 rpp21 snm1 subunit domain-containing protein n=1 Tax=Ophiostoma piceae (strain UAMH 11346) TaxID=1262450 RepID=S3BXN1_OPHP1|nr:rnase p rpr2 rpp21 snm1 subunit domain-containing protein [Ophiostoma piceae UAMH 11346]